MITKKFMLDIEATGIEYGEDLLQIYILELDWVDNYWQPNRSFEFYQFTAKLPESNFAKAHLRDIYRVCHDSSWVAPQKVRENILKFFKDCGADRFPTLCGWCVASWDIPFLVAKDYLQMSAYDKENNHTGDYNYLVDDTEGAIQHIAESYAVSREKIIERSRIIGRHITNITLPDSHSHNAMFDCYEQTILKNGLLAFQRRLGG